MTASYGDWLRAKKVEKDLEKYLCMNCPVLHSGGTL